MNELLYGRSFLSQLRHASDYSVDDHICHLISEQSGYYYDIWVWDDGNQDAKELSDKWYVFDQKAEACKGTGFLRVDHLKTRMIFLLLDGLTQHMVVIKKDDIYLPIREEMLGLVRQEYEAW